MHVKFLVLVAATFLLAGPSGTVIAQDSAAVFVDIAPCLPLTGDAERHACLDRLVDGVKQAQQRARTPAQTDAVVAPPVPATPAPAFVAEPVPAPAPATVPTSAPETAPAAETAVEAFGTQAPAQARVEANESGEQELFDRIVKMVEREPDRWLITLESGQVWYQTNSQRMRLRVGMDVRIYPSPLGGSYRMARNDGTSTGFVQVRRVQ